eukprot:scaffold1610_cov257-Pinguiococcus_pyrenoidosus.AAC.29
MGAEVGVSGAGVVVRRRGRAPDGEHDLRIRTQISVFHRKGKSGVPSHCWRGGRAKLRWRMAADGHFVDGQAVQIHVRGDMKVREIHILEYRG